MFEVGFQELVLIALLALIVLGPEKLPKLAANLGRWTGRARSMARNLRQQLENEVSYEDLMKQKELAEDALRTAQAAPMKFHEDLDAQIKSAATAAEAAIMPSMNTPGSTDTAASDAATDAALAPSQAVSPDADQPEPAKHTASTPA